jgi:hypothetical protein
MAQWNRTNATDWEIYLNQARPRLVTYRPAASVAGRTKPRTLAESNLQTSKNQQLTFLLNFSRKSRSQCTIICTK